MSEERVQGAPAELCARQLSEVQDGLERLADPFLWEEIDRLVQVHALGLRGPGAGEAADPCAVGTRDALVAVTTRWAEQGAATGGPRSYGLARKAFAALLSHFPAAADEPRLRQKMGHLEWIRAEKISIEVGERTLSDEAYRAAHEHLVVALAGGLPPELAAAAGREQLEAIRRVHGDAAPRWNMAEETCVPDARGRCRDPTPRVAPTEMSAGDREWLAAYDAFLAVQGLRGDPEWVAVTTARATLLMKYRRWDEAEAGLRAVVGPGRVEARRLLLGVLLARWMEAAGAGERAAARDALIAASDEVAPDEGEIGALAASLRRSALWAQGEEARLAGELARCGAAFERVHAEVREDPAAAFEAAEGAGLCYEGAGDTAKAILWLGRLADQENAADPRSLAALLRLAHLHAQILDDEPARARYLEFLDRAPRGDRRISIARREWIALTLRSGTLPESQIETRLHESSERQLLVAGIRFRTALRPGVGSAPIVGYIERFGRDGGPQRLAIAHVRAAEALLRESCPIDGAEGVCAQVGRDKMPGRVVPRDPKLLARAREHLEQARRLLPEGLRGAAEKLDAPLRVKPEELRAAGRLAALLQGDLDAELALSTRPPASLDPTRSRAWLAVRRAEVERMSAVYEKAGADDASERDAAAALVETRKAQVYESDLVQLEEVAAAVAAAGDAELAGQMRELAAQRREAVYLAYTRCIELVAAWGHDPGGQSQLCRAGLGRLVGRYEEPLEYTPDASGRIGLPGQGAPAMVEGTAPAKAG